MQDGWDRPHPTRVADETSLDDVDEVVAKDERSSTRKAGTDAQKAPVSHISREKYLLILYQSGNDGLQSLSTQLVSYLREELEDLITEPRAKVEIDVWLESPGGDLHAAYKVVLLLRAYASHVRVVIPDYAKSAATLLALAADEIYMSPAAELGPLDAQILYEQEGAMVSALDLARAFEDLAWTGVDLALRSGATVLNMTQLGRKDALSFMLDFASKFTRPMIKKFDPTMIHQASQLLEVSVQYAKRVLELREAPECRTDDVPRRLVERYPTHSFVISAEEARSLGLPVFAADEYGGWKSARELHRQIYGQNEEPEGLVKLVRWADDSDVESQGSSLDETEAVDDTRGGSDGAIEPDNGADRQSTRSTRRQKAP